jgi:hypothetical protein
MEIEMHATTTDIGAGSVGAPALSTYQQHRAAQREAIRSRYTDEQKAAIRLLYTAVKVFVGTSGGNTCAKLLLGLYNGYRFPFDLTDLRLLDARLFRAAMTVIQMDAQQTYCEVHVLLDALYDDGRSTGAEFEQWAYNLKLKGRCKKDAPDLSMPTRDVSKAEREAMYDR